MKINMLLFGFALFVSGFALCSILVPYGQVSNILDYMLGGLIVAFIIFLKIKHHNIPVNPDTTTN